MLVEVLPFSDCGRSATQTHDCLRVRLQYYYSCLSIKWFKGSICVDLPVPFSCQCEVGQRTLDYLRNRTEVLRISGRMSDVLQFTDSGLSAQHRPTDSWLPVCVCASMCVCVCVCVPVLVFVCVRMFMCVHGILNTWTFKESVCVCVNMCMCVCMESWKHGPLKNV